VDINDQFTSFFDCVNNQKTGGKDAFKISFAGIEDDYSDRGDEVPWYTFYATKLTTVNSVSVSSGIATALTGVATGLTYYWTKEENPWYKKVADLPADAWLGIVAIGGALMSIPYAYRYFFPKKKEDLVEVMDKETMETETFTKGGEKKVKEKDRGTGTKEESEEPASEQRVFWMNFFIGLGLGAVVIVLLFGFWYFFMREDEEENDVSDTPNSSFSTLGDASEMV